MIEIYAVPKVDIFEYFCKNCGHLRLSLRGEKIEECGNCGAGTSDLIIGKPGELDKEKLKAEYATD